jgi:hypothetical protein
MAVYTKLRRRRVRRLYADPSCYQDRVLVQVWTILEGEHTPVKRFLSDLTADCGLHEIFDIVRAESKAGADHNIPILFWP